jgi:alpha-beta hydrolase superfamily lysophospholipase
MPAPVSAAKFPARPWYSPLRLLQRLVIYAVIGYVTFCVYLFFAQNSLLYPRAATGAVLPIGKATEMAHSVGLMPWDRTTPGADAPQGYVRSDFTRSTSRGTVVVFHGNADWAWARTGYVEAITRRGFRTFLYEYPGYGGRPGRPSEATIVPDARALIRSLDQAGYGPVYVWGESLGAGVAASVCADSTLPVQGLVLLTPWDTLAHAASAHYPYVPVSLLLTDKYDSVANLEQFKHPICVVRSTQDEIIPPPLTIHLFAHLPEPKKVILQEGYGHDNWPSAPDLPWWDDALNFIAPPERALVGP